MKTSFPTFLKPKSNPKLNRKQIIIGGMALGLGIFLRLFWVFYNEGYNWLIIFDEIFNYSKALLIVKGEWEGIHLGATVYPLDQTFVPGFFQNVYYATLYKIWATPLLPILIIVDYWS